MGSMVKEPAAYTSFLEIKREGQREGALIYELPTAIGDTLAGWSQSSWGWVAYTRQLPKNKNDKKEKSII